MCTPDAELGSSHALHNVLRVKEQSGCSRLSLAWLSECQAILATLQEAPLNADGNLVYLEQSGAPRSCCQADLTDWGGKRAAASRAAVMSCEQCASQQC